MENENKELNTLMPGLLAVVLVSVIVGGFFFWQKQSLNEMREELKKELAKKDEPIMTPQPEADRPLDETPIATTSASPALSPTVDDYTDWITYTNDVYHYQFKFPTGASIEEAKKEAFSLSPDEVDAGMTFEEKHDTYTGKICISLEYKLGYVQISAPDNKNFAQVICGRTGRAYEGPDKSETLTIDGKTYTAKGFEEQGPGETLDFHNETLVVTLEDGTRIEYGSRPDASATYADYLTIRDNIFKIVESFKKI
ncbi:hypothetical protein ISS85_04670 [Candidatus Microgenomates bacterium]|nr:hypothetical protein [Candidatus Microgenomates bacterium]